MNRDLSFSQNLKAGVSKQELMTYYALTEYEYERVIRCLADIRARAMRTC
ncbi:MAG: hypothetical protein OIN84_10880 [Candidatus Methanoperedens sp.]|nr:hypothetical protein [Candidatus Methanoperedens sp. BLZ2]MBZ0174447.1 hypothetical protein [Candidatus Methanoperedens nitroreducens]MCX9078467.1 hypothetical protein [Candidatus Methanoperedens sp.]